MLAGLAALVLIASVVVATRDRGPRLTGIQRTSNDHGEKDRIRRETRPFPHDRFSKAGGVGLGGAG
jgi:hypothetical protein